MKKRKYEKGYNISTRVCNKYSELISIIACGKKNTNEYSKCLYELKVLVSNEKSIYNELDKDSATEYYKVCMNVNSDDFYSRFNEIEQRYFSKLAYCFSSPEEILEYKIIDGMVLIEALRTIKKRIKDTFTNNKADAYVKIELLFFHELMCPCTLMLSFYTEELALKYNFNIENIPPFDIKKEIGNNNYCSTIISNLFVSIKALFSNSKKENSVEEIYRMLLHTCQIEIYLDLLNPIQRLDVINYYNIARVGYENTLMDTTLKRLLSK